MSGWIISLILVAICGILMVLESKGLSTTLTLSFKSDLKRETRFVAQYGQLACMIFVIPLVLQLDREHGQKVCVALVITWLGTSIVATTIKRAIGRARPRSEFAGRFLGPSFRHANYRESFPSSHSAVAMTMTVVLATAYPHGAATFWALALICAGLRYFMDAHWPSDVLGGIALGYAMGILGCWFFSLPK